MTTTASAAHRRALLLALGVLVTTLALAVAVLFGREGNASGAGAGPLEFSTADAELVFPNAEAPGDASVTAGALLLCAPQPGIVIDEVVPVDGIGVHAFEAKIRIFRIRESNHQGVVGEPVLAAYGAPPRVELGGPRHHTSLLAGTLIDGNHATVDVPTCAETTSAPGERTVELLLSLTGGPAGAKVAGVTVRYHAGGTAYEAHIPVGMILCGSQVTDPDC